MYFARHFVSRGVQFCLQSTNHDCRSFAYILELRRIASGRCRFGKKKWEDPVFIYFFLTICKVENICRQHDLRAMSIDDQKKLSAIRNAEIEKLRVKYVATKKMTEDQLALVLNSLGDGNA